MSLLTWVAFLLCVTAVFGSGHQGMGRLSQALLDKRLHPSLDIINGNKTSVKKYPFMASVLWDGHEFGSAVILNERQTPYIFRVGTNIYYQGGQLLYPAKIVIHPKYTGNWDYDIALVKTKQKIKFSEKVQPVKLGTLYPKPGNKGTVLGWGMYAPVSGPSQRLREGKVTVIDWDECKNIYTTNITTKFVCTFDERVGPCSGDVGAPLLVDNQVVGLFASSFDCIPGYYPDIYTDIQSYYKWIKDTIQSETGSSDLHLFFLLNE